MKKNITVVIIIFSYLFFKKSQTTNRLLHWCRLALWLYVS